MAENLIKARVHLSTTQHIVLAFRSGWCQARSLCVDVIEVDTTGRTVFLQLHCRRMLARQCNVILQCFVQDFVNLMRTVFALLILVLLITLRNFMGMLAIAL